MKTNRKQNDYEFLIVQLNSLFYGFIVFYLKLGFYLVCFCTEVIVYIDESFLCGIRQMF